MNFNYNLPGACDISINKVEIKSNFEGKFVTIKSPIQGLKYNIRWVAPANTLSFVVKFVYRESSRKSVDSNNFNMQTFTGSVLVSVAASKLMLIFIPSQSQSQAFLLS